MGYYENEKLLRLKSEVASHIFVGITCKNASTFSQ